MTRIITKLGLTTFIYVALYGLNIPAMAQDCVEHDVGLNQWGTKFKTAGFPANIGVSPGTEQTSCVRFVGLKDSTRTFEMQRRGYEYRINEGPWVRHDTVSDFGDGDSIYVRTKVSNANSVNRRSAYKIDGVWSGNWTWQTENTGRAPDTWKVGPGREHRQLSDIQSQLVAGDIVELDGNAIYNAVEFTRSGTSDQPILIRGIAIDGKRPVLKGDLPPNSRGRAKDWTLAFTQSHYYEIENVEVTGGKAICVRHSAHHITIRNSYIHHCQGHGILSSDLDSGTLILDEVEVAWVGRAVSGGSIKHAIYVTTDHHQFPDAKFQIGRSFIHDFRGNGIKSRANRSEILFNWIEQSEWINPEDARDHSFYSLELIGPDGREPDEPIESLVVGNVLEHKNNIALYGLRIGGDGTGYSIGKVWLTSNIFIHPSGNTDRAVFRLQYRLNSVYLRNNLFIRADEVAAQWSSFRLFRDDVKEWHSNGEKLVYGENNWFPPNARLARPTDLSTQIRNQWGESNKRELPDVKNVYFDSSKGVITLPSVNTILTDSSGLNESLDNRYVVNELIEYSGQSDKILLVRPDKSNL